MKYEVVIPARNEENFLEETLKSIKRQTLPPSKVIVVDDGSTDDTFEIAQKYADLVLRRADRGHVAFGTIELPKVFNDGLHEVSVDADYVLINGADDILPSNYVEVLYRKMASNPVIAMMSGRTDDGESTNYSGLPPRGSGRLINAKIWREINGLRYPETLGWETWLVYKIRMLGYHAEQTLDLAFHPQRLPLKGALNRAFINGKEMKALGYSKRYLFYMAMRYGFKNPIAGLRLLWGFYKQKEKLDCAEWVANEQRRIFWKRVGFHLKRILGLKS
jgi:glycosyltransferase involved in cell wall biosynthesis